MEFLNKVILRGIVGSIHRTPIESGAKHSFRFSIMTQHCLFNAAGESIVECMWMNVVGVESHKMNTADIKRGSKVEVKGRLRNITYADTEGNQRSSFDICPSEIRLLDDSQ